MITLLTNYKQNYIFRFFIFNSGDFDAVSWESHGTCITIAGM